jgi:hypothetical protein
LLPVFLQRLFSLCIVDFVVVIVLALVKRTDQPLVHKAVLVLVQALGPVHVVVLDRTHPEFLQRLDTHTSG